MLVVRYRSAGWSEWFVDGKPLIAERIPILIDDDLFFEDGAGERVTVPVNRWLRELPTSGAPSPRTWSTYARVLKSWLEFLSGHDVHLFDSAERLRAALSAMTEHHTAGPLEARWSPATWNLHVSVLAKFYRWAIDNDYAAAEPFTYSWCVRSIQRQFVNVRRNNAKQHTAQPHSSIKYLEGDFVEIFVNALSGMRPDGSVETAFRGRELGRNAAMGRAVIASGLRRQEFTYLLVYEVPLLPPRRTAVPIGFPVGRGVSKGRKPRTTWIDYDALAELHGYIALERASACNGFVWRPPPSLGPALHVENPDSWGADINGSRRSWASLLPEERVRLVAPDGSACILGLQSTGRPFTDWPTVFRRTSVRIRARYEPRFPTVYPHRLRHTFAMRTLEWLVDGHYRRAAALASQTDTDTGLSLYLQKADPMCVLRDLLGHSSVTTTEMYLRRLDVTRIFSEASRKAADPHVAPSKLPVPQLISSEDR